MKSENFKQDVEQILKHGIVEYGTRYESQCKLVYHYWSLGYSTEECYRAISKWYHSHDHQSKDWKSKPERVLRNLRRDSNSFYRNAHKKGFKPQAEGKEWKQLRLSDVLCITKITRNYRIQKFTFGVLRYALNQKDSKEEFRLPWKTIMKFDCCSTESYKKLLEFCEYRGLISKVKEYYRQEHRARTYKVNFPFSAEGEFTCSLEEGLKKLFSPRILRLRYSRWVYEHNFKQLFKDTQM